MITATVALLAVVLAVFLGIALRELKSLGEEQAEARGAAVHQATRDMAESLARNTAVASSAALLEGGYLYLHTLVETTARSNRDVRYVIIADDAGRVVADSRLPLGKTPTEPLADDISARVRTAGPGKVVASQDRRDSDLWIFAAPVRVSEGTDDGADEGPGGEAPESSEAVIGHVRVGMSMQAQEREVAAARDAARARVERAIRLAALAAALLLIAGIIFAVLQGIRLSRPIMHLAEQAEAIAQGDLDRRVEPQGATEIQHLSLNFNEMADRISELLEETARKAVMEKELEIARLVQASLVPPPRVVDAGGVALVGFFEPASECGGDWWLWRKLGDDRVIVLIADVTGHGLPAALITATAIGCAETLPDDIGPEQALQHLNRAVARAGKGKFWMSCFVTVFDVRTGYAEYANAGHPMPYVARKRDGGWKLDSLAARGPLLGEEPLPSVRVRKTEIGPDDVVFWYTDGLNECFGPEGKPWGEGALRRALADAVTALDDDGLDEGVVTTSVRDHVMSEVRAFAASTPQRDDLTIVVGTGVGKTAELEGSAERDVDDEGVGTERGSARRAG